MQSYELIRYAAITLVLFYFSTSHGFLDTCPKRSSVTDECYQHGDKYMDYRRSSERRVADVAQSNEDLNRNTSPTGDGRMLDTNNNRITLQRDRSTSNKDQSTRLRSFSTISRRSDRINQRRNAGNSMQKPTLEARVLEDNTRRTLEITKSGRRFSRTHETEARRSRQPNSNEFRQREATEERNSEERILKLEHMNTREDRNKVRDGKGTSRLRQTGRILLDRRKNEDVDVNRRSPVRDSADSSRLTRDYSQSGRNEQISPARHNRQSSMRRESVSSDARRDVASSRSGREERAFVNPSTIRRGGDAKNRDTSRLRQLDRSLAEHKSNEDIDNRRRSLVRDSDDRRRSGREEQISLARTSSSIHRETVSPDARRFAASSRSGREERAFRWERDTKNRDTSRLRQPVNVLAEHRTNEDVDVSRRSSVRDSDDGKRSGREQQISPARDSRRSSIRRETVLSDARRDAAFSRSGREERAFSIFRRERDAKNRDASKLRQLDTVLADHRTKENVDGSRRSSVRDSDDRRRSGREEQISPARDSRRSSIRRETVLSDARRDAAFSRSGREERASSIFRWERDAKNRDTSKLRQLDRVLADHRTNEDVDVSRRSSVRNSDDRRRSSARSTRDHPRYEREEILREIIPSRSSAHRDISLPTASADASQFRRQERSSAVRDSRQSSIRRELSLPDTRRNVVHSRSIRQEPDSFRRKIPATNAISSSFRQEPRESRRQLAPSSSVSRREESIRVDRQSLVRRKPALSSSRLDATSSMSRQEERRSSFARDIRQIVSPADVRREQKIASVHDGSPSSIRREFLLSNSRRDVESSRYRREERPTRGNQQTLTRRFSPADDGSTRHEITTFRRQESSSFARNERRLAPADTRRDANVSMFRRKAALDRRELALSNARRDATSSGFREEPSRTSFHREDRTKTSVRSHTRSSSRVDEDRTRRGKNLSTSKTDEQRLIKKRSFEENDRRLDVSSRRLIDEELYPRASFSERVKSETRDNFGYQLTSRIAKDWSNLVNTLLIALTLLQILAKTYPKKTGFQNLLQNSLGYVKHKVQ